LRMLVEFEYMCEVLSMMLLRWDLLMRLNCMADGEYWASKSKRLSNSTGM
jgi:hypothetical protein